MQPTSEHWNDIQNALVQAFPNMGDLERFVMFKLGKDLTTIVPAGATEDVVFHLLKWVNSEGLWKQLLRAASQERPANENLQSTCARFLTHLETPEPNADDNQFDNDVPSGLLRGIAKLSQDYAGRVENFLTEYLGAPDSPVPFGGREEELRLLDEWLKDSNGSPYRLLVGPAGRGKSACLVRWLRRLREEEELDVVFFPVSTRFSTNLKSVVFGGLAARLAEIHQERIAGNIRESAETLRDAARQYLGRPVPGGGRLLVIIDGIDEAADWVTGADLFPLEPPEGLRVLVSARLRPDDPEGKYWRRSLGWERDDLASTVRLRPLAEHGVSDVLLRMGVPLDDLSRRVDIVQQLHRLSEGDPLLVRLYVDDLWRRGDEAVRLKPEDLEEIQPGIEGYFDKWWDHQLRLWGTESPLRERSVRTTLNVLACALGPVTKDALVRLGGLESWDLDFVLPVLSRFVIGTGKEGGYVFSHPRLRNYFYDKLTVEERIACEGCFLDWGEQVLDELSNGERTTLNVESYVIQYFGAHLERSERSLAQLLRLTSEPWRQTWEGFEGTLGGFLGDVERVWRLAAKLNEENISSGLVPLHLTEEMRCLLILSSVASVSSNVPPVLLGALLECNIWNSVQAIAFTRQIPEDHNKVAAFGALAPHLAREKRSEVLQEAVLAAFEFSSPVDRAQSLTLIAPFLPDSLRGAALGTALEATANISTEMVRANTLTQLVPHLGSSLLAKAVEIANQISIRHARFDVILRIVPHLDTALRETVVATTLAEVRSNSSTSSLVEVLAALAPYFDDEKRRVLIEEAIAAAKNLGVGSISDENMAKLAAYLAEEQLVGLMERSKNFVFQEDRVKLLTRIKPYLPDSHRPVAQSEMLAAAKEIRWNDDQARVLWTIAEHVGEMQIDAAARIAIDIKDEVFQARAFESIASRMSEPERTETLLKQLERLEKARGDNTHLTVRIARHLNEPHRTAILLEQLQRSQVVSDEEFGTALTLNLMNNMPDEDLGDCLPAVKDSNDSATRDSVLALIAHRIPMKFLSECLDLGGVETRTSIFHRIGTLPSLPADVLDRLERQGSNYYAAQALVILADHVDASRRESLQATAVERLLQSVGARLGSKLFNVMEFVASRLSEKTLSHTFNRINKVDSVSAAALRLLVAHHSQDKYLIDSAVGDLAEQIESHPSDGVVVDLLLPYLSDQELRTCVSRWSEDVVLGPATLTRYAELFSAVKRGTFVSKRLSLEVSRWSVRVPIADALLSMLDQDSISAFTSEVQKLDDSTTKVIWYCLAACHLSEPLKSKVVEIAFDIVEEDVRRHGRTGRLFPRLDLLFQHLRPGQIQWYEESVTPHLNAADKNELARAVSSQLVERGDLYRYFQRTLSALSRSGRETVLERLGAIQEVLVKLAGPEALRGLIAEMKDSMARWP